MKRIIVMMLLVCFIMTLFVGCKSESISTECMDYFTSLKGKKYWAQQPIDLTLEDKDGKDISPLKMEEPEEECCIEFYNIKITSKNKNNQPMEAIVTLNVSDTELVIKVNNKNEKALKKVLPETETDEARNTRLYGVAFNNAKDFLEKEDYQSCISEINEAKKYIVTDELNTMSDSAHYKIGEVYCEEKKYTQAITELQQVQFDKDTKDKAEILLKEIGQKVKAELDRIQRTLSIEYSKSSESTSYIPKLAFRDQGTTAMGTNMSSGELVWGNINFLPSMIISKNGKRTCYITLFLTISDWIFANQVTITIRNKKYSTSKCNESDTKRTIDAAGNFFEAILFSLDIPQNNEFARTLVNVPLGEKMELKVAGKEELTFLLCDVSEAEHQAWKDMIFFYDNGGN